MRGGGWVGAAAAGAAPVPPEVRCGGVGRGARNPGDQPEWAGSPTQRQSKPVQLGSMTIPCVGPRRCEPPQPQLQLASWPAAPQPRASREPDNAPAAHGGARPIWGEGSSERGRHATASIRGRGVEGDRRGATARRSGGGGGGGVEDRGGRPRAHAHLRHVPQSGAAGGRGVDRLKANYATGRVRLARGAEGPHVNRGGGRPTDRLLGGRDHAPWDAHAASPRPHPSAAAGDWRLTRPGERGRRASARGAVPRRDGLASKAQQRDCPA